MTTTPIRSSGSSAAVPTPPADDHQGGLRAAIRKLDIKGTPYLFIAPFFLIFGVFGAYPLLYTGWVSLHDWDFGATENQPFIGLDNYSRLLGDEYFWNSLKNTLGIFVVGTIPQLLLALALAHTLNRHLKGRTFWRMSVLLPNITSVSAVAIIFNQIYGRDYGVVNYVLGLVGIGPIDWQSGTLSSWFAIATMVDWRWTGYNALIYLAAMQAIPRDLYEAASIDGAGQWKQFWSVTIPSLRPTIIFTVIVSTIGSFQLFAEPLLFDNNPATANGGDSRQFQTIALFLYQEGFKNMNFGYAAAISWMLFFVIILMGIVNYLITKRISSSEG